MKSEFYIEELSQMRKNYKNKPLSDIKLCHPKWLDSQDPMFKIYDEKSTLLQKGEIIYASILQANNFLFKNFPPFNCPAQILYSKDLYFVENPERLHIIASKIYSYKGQEPDSVPNEWKEVVSVITDELDRSDFTFSAEIENRSVEYSMIPIMAFRKLLPKRRLCGNIIPILTADECEQVLILPKQYWSKRFKELWVNGTI